MSDSYSTFDHNGGTVRSRTNGDGSEIDPAIETSGLTKVYGETTAVAGLDLTVDAGEIFGFLGPNGAGKSTTINMLLGFLAPSNGTGAVLGHDIEDESVALREQVGVLPEGYGLYNRLSGRRHLAFAVDWKDADDDPEALLERVGLNKADADRPVGDYSKGMRQRLALGMALVGDPDLLILDEPSAGLDPHGIKQMREIVREEADAGTTVFFSSHILGEVEAICDRVGILYEGELVAVDTVDGLRRAVGASSELRLRVDEEPNVSLADIDGVDDLRYEGGVVYVECRQPRAKVEVVTRLADAGITILDIGAEEASLEDVFAAYTNDSGVSDGPIDQPGADVEVEA